MPFNILDRRAMLALAGSSLLMTIVSGCTTPAPGLTPEAKTVRVGVIRVTGTANRTLELLAPMVAEELASELGPRYAPGSRGGATLLVELTGDVLDDSTNGGSREFRFSTGGAVDQLEGRVVLAGPHGEAYTSFPFLVSTGATFRSILDIYPDPRRLRNLAQAYAHWTVAKLR